MAAAASPAAKSANGTASSFQRHFAIVIAISSFGTRTRQR
jgi:hypothetical protein